MFEMKCQVFLLNGLYYLGMFEINNNNLAFSEVFSPKGPF